MENNNHKGTEFNNINDTWNQNEKRREEGLEAGTSDATTAGATVSNDLQQIIKEEAAEYDNANKEDRVLGGDRASVNDDGSGSAS